MIIIQEKSVDKPQNIFEVSQILFHQENLKNVIDYLSWYYQGAQYFMSFLYYFPSWKPWPITYLYNYFF
jgi:hypothetical protein